MGDVATGSVGAGLPVPALFSAKSDRRRRKVKQWRGLFAGSTKTEKGFFPAGSHPFYFCFILVCWHHITHRGRERGEKMKVLRSALGEECSVSKYHAQHGNRCSARYLRYIS